MIKRVFLNISNLYIALFLLYYYLSAIQPNTITGGLLIIEIVISIYFFIKVNLCYSLPLYFKGLNALVFLLTLYGVFGIVNNETIVIQSTGDVLESSSYLRSIYSSLLPIYPFYYFTRKGYLTESNMKAWVILFLLVAYHSYYYAQLHHVERALEIGIESEMDNFTNNVGYTFLLLIPCLSLYEKKEWLFFSCFLLCISFILISSKRGAIFITAIIVVLYLFHFVSKDSNVSKNKIVYNFTISIIFIVSLSYFVTTLFTSNEYFYEKMYAVLEGDTNGRDDLSSFFLNYYSNFDFLHAILGGGADTTILVGENYAHNDWLELLINQGVLGICVYLFYWFMFYRTAIIYRKCPYGHVLIIIAILLLLKSFFSMSYNGLNMYLCCMLGYSLGNSYMYKQQYKM